MPVMPQYQPNPYMEPPSFIVPHSHLHLMDYRRMLSPQYYQTMAYHTRRFRYQHNVQPRETTSCEVQTEPLVPPQRTPGSSNTEASNSVQCSSIPTSVPLPPAVAVQRADRPVDLRSAGPSSTSRSPPRGSFVIQTEEVRIECCTTPVGLQVLHAHETAELSHSFSQDLVQCSSILQGHVLQEEVLCLPADPTEQSLQACPDILLVGTPSSGSTGAEKISALEESGNLMDHMSVTSDVGSRMVAYSDVEEMRCEQNLSASRISKNVHFKVVNLPFDPKYLDELRKMESIVWSAEETSIHALDTSIQNDHKETLPAIAEVPSADSLLERKEVPPEELVSLVEMTPSAEETMEEMVPTLEGSADEILSDVDICAVMDVAIIEEPPESEETSALNLPLLDNFPPQVGADQPRQVMNDQDQQDTSFESLPAYLPSTSWLTDFENVYFSSKMPPTPKKQSKSLSSRGVAVTTRRRKLDLEYKEPPTVRKPKERYKSTSKADRRSLSDHECCLNRNFNDNALTLCGPKRERLCGRCLAKRRIRTSNDGRNLKRKAVPFQPWNDTVLPTCDACKSHSKNTLMRKGSSLDIRSPHREHDTEGESSENSCCRTGSKWRRPPDPKKLNDLKRPLTSKQNLEKHPVGLHPKHRVKNCACNEPPQPVAWERLCQCPHGNAIREMDENCAVPVSPQDKWSNVDQVHVTHRWQTGKQTGF